MIFLLFFSFLAGFATILAPCIWPLLPLVLSASSTGDRRKPLGLTLGVMTSFTLFTLSVSYLESFLHISPDLFRLVAVVIISLLGVSLLFPSLGSRFEILVGRLLQPLQSRFRGSAIGAGFGAGYVAGFSIGMLWAPCAGPILATVATLAATKAVNVQVFLVALAYALGLGIPLFLLSMGGSFVFAKMRRVTKYTGLVQQAFGLVMICVAVLIYTNYDKTIQLKILTAFPGYGNLLNGIETNQTVADQLAALRGGTPEKAPQGEAGKLEDLGPAPEFKGIKSWLNSGPITMEQLRGKVVLVDFWTYSCINCLRTLPHTEAWYHDYGPSGFVLIGVHAPEFAFEKDTGNVKNALGQFDISYPVAQDNDFETWKAYRNEYWPAEYLIDAKGHIRLQHLGEGHYDEMDRAIRQLLSEAGHPVVSSGKALLDTDPNYAGTPESYLGLARLERFKSNEAAAAGTHTYTLPASLSADQIAFQGTWTLSNEEAKASKGSAIEIQFTADKVFLVLGPEGKMNRLALFLDGKPIAAFGGADVERGELIVDKHRLYNLVDLKGSPGTHRLRIVFDSDGTSAYAFTFG
jgi:cytochrome c biogenesis protein CcdA/thiol-disulfide isomerase/thioredoxin